MSGIYNIVILFQMKNSFNYRAQSTHYCNTADIIFRFSLLNLREQMQQICQPHSIKRKGCDWCAAAPQYGTLLRTRPFIRN